MTDEPREGSDRSRIAGLRPVKVQTEPYDATHDPRTGRPPNPLEAQHLARKHDRERLERENEDGSPAGPAADSVDNTAPVSARKSLPVWTRRNPLKMNWQPWTPSSAKACARIGGRPPKGAWLQLANLEGSGVCGG